MPVGPPNPEYWADFPPIDNEVERQKAYQTQRFIDEANAREQRRLAAEKVVERDPQERLEQS